MTASTQEANKDLVRRHFEAVNERDKDAIAEFHADDVVVHGGGREGREIQGIEAVLQVWWAQLEAIPDLTDTINLLLAEDDKVAIRYKTTGTHEGELLGIEPTGETVEVTSMAVVRVEDGKIAEWWNHPNRFELFRQLGAIESPGE